ncbi:cyclase family protein [Agromyces sp. MMS24-JH15]|uniref:cyclase family protein n=1 Tax=Agromyces sp. MMS24-JH15 TaxID=3243765 RepID=UPI00374A3530
MRELSRRIESGMQVYPGDPEVRVEPALDLARDGAAVAALHLGSHTGTHLDAPAHAIPGGRTTAAVRLEELVGDALVVHLGPLAPRARISFADLDRAVPGGLPARVPPIVVVDTGWASRFGTQAALEHPYLDPDAAAELLRRGVHVLATDALSPDPTAGGETDPAQEGSAQGGPAQVEPGFPVHAAVLGADGLIVENLANLDGLPEQVRVGFFPLPIDADGAPVRAVAFDAEPDDDEPDGAGR